ncbi:hypothetical protein FRB90_000786, partial [Tulasnella sp. 427]
MDRDDPPQDKPKDDELPTYAAVEAEEPQAAARWNRWRGWIEKRRVATAIGSHFSHQLLTPLPHLEPQNAMQKIPREDPDDDQPAPVEQLDGEPQARPPARRQHTQLNIAPPDYIPAEPSLPQGEAYGLSVVDVLPSLHPRKDQAPVAQPGLAAQPLADAVAIPIWTGEAVYQLDLLEDATSDMNPDNPQGVVLALVGPSDEECNKTIRMYNLASLASLVRWYCSQGDHPPLDMGRSTGQSLGTLARARLRKSRRQSDIAKGIRALVVDDLKAASPATSSPSISLATPARRNDRSRSPVNSPPNSRGNSFPVTPPQSTTSLLTAGSPIRPTHIPKSPSQTSVASSSWDIVDELPTRWATDYVPFASANSRLTTVQILFYQLYKSTGGRMPTSLAIATKSSILLYESPRNERAFKFAKASSKSISFTVQSGNKASASEHTQSSSSSSSGTLRKNRSVDYGTQTCLFVAFEKKAGLIRIGDSAVQEVESFPDLGASMSTVPPRPRPSPMEGGISLSSGPVRRSIAASFDGSAFWRSHPPWLGLVELQLPPLAVSAAYMMSADDSRLPSLPGSICFITRGRTTQIHPVPLPMSFNNTALSTTPLKTLTWQHQATKIHARLSLQATPQNPVPESARGPPAPLLQVIGLGPEGVEIQEFGLEFLLKKQDAKDKGKARATFDSDPIVRAYADVGGAAGFLCCGGQWNKPMSRMTSPVNDIRGVLNSTIYESGGMYGWVSKGDNAELGLGSLLLHSDDSPNEQSISPPISLSSTFRHQEGFDYVNDWDPADPKHHVYSRYTTPVSIRVEKVLSALLKGHAITYSSGLQAAHAAVTLYNPKRIAITKGYIGVHHILDIRKRSVPESSVIDLDDDYREGDLA